MPDSAQADLLACLPQIVVALQVEPELGCGIERLGQAQRHFRADTRMPVDDERYGAAGYLKPLREFRYRNAHRVQVHFLQYFAPVTRARFIRQSLRRRSND